MTSELLMTGSSLADYDEVYKITKPLSDIMTSGKTIRVTSDAGSDFTASIEGVVAGCGASFA